MRRGGEVVGSRDECERKDGRGGRGIQTRASRRGEEERKMSKECRAEGSGRFKEKTKNDLTLKI